jgi:hypothetical protein
MYSLAQKRMMAKQAGKTEVVLTMEEVENEMAKSRELDEQILKYMAYVPVEVLQAEAKEMFGDRDEWSSDE